MEEYHALHGPLGVRVHLLRIDLTHIKAWYRWLSNEERYQLLDYTRLKRRREFVAGRVAARGLLADVLSCAPEDVGLTVAGEGWIDVAAEPWSVSIAHSEEYAIAACARHAIGVDLERIRPVRSGMKRFLVHEDEQSFWPVNPSPRDIVRWWTIKESVLKARRSGLRMMASRLRMGQEPRHGTAHVIEPDGTSWHVSFDEVEDYCWAVAIPQQVISDHA